MNLIERLTFWYYTGNKPLEVGAYKDARVYLVPNLTPKWAGGQTVNKNIYISHAYYENLAAVEEEILAHEYAHVKQYEKYGTMGFLIRYFWNFLVLIIKYQNSAEAYNNHPFEVEAKEAEVDNHD